MYGLAPASQPARKRDRVPGVYGGLQPVHGKMGGLYGALRAVVSAAAVRVGAKRHVQAVRIAARLADVLRALELGVDIPRPAAPRLGRPYPGEQPARVGPKRHERAVTPKVHVVLDEYGGAGHGVAGLRDEIPRECDLGACRHAWLYVVEVEYARRSLRVRRSCGCGKNKGGG